ncbi:MAG: hypothetical protein MJ054_02625 [Clostridia bacterium]|nr:hypothetical protein [Clostridia bacterium]
MQKEDLIKRLRLFATITTTVFVVLVVTLLIQFGFIAHYHNQIKQLQDHNSAVQQEIEGLEKELDYIKGEYAENKARASN